MSQSNLAPSVEPEVEAREEQHLMELIWQDALLHLVYSNNEIFLPQYITGLIGEDGVGELKHRLSDRIATPVVSFIDPSIHALRIMQRPEFRGSTVSIPTTETLSNMQKKVSESLRPASEHSKVPRPRKSY